MSKRHTTVVAALLALAVVLGSVAVFKTAGLGTASQQANNAAAAAKARQLAAYQRGLEKALAAKTPALPKVPQARVVYRRPPPIVVVKHTQHGDDDEAEGGGGGDG